MFTIFMGGIPTIHIRLEKGHCFTNMVVSINGGSLIVGWLMGNPIKMDDLGYPHFRKPPHCSCIRITREICPAPPGSLKFSSAALRRLNLQRSRRIGFFLRGHGPEAEEARTKLEKMKTTCHNENNDD